jgi:hypothetical protein
MPTRLDENFRAADLAIAAVRAQLRTAANVPEDVSDLTLAAPLGAAVDYAAHAGGQLTATRAESENRLFDALGRLSSNPALGPGPVPAHYRELMHDVGGRGFNMLERRSTVAALANATVGNCHEMAMLGYDWLRNNCTVGPIEAVTFSAGWVCIVQYTDADDRQLTLGTSPGWPGAIAANEQAGKIAAVLADSPIDVSAPTEDDSRERRIRDNEAWRVLTSDHGRVLLRSRDQSALPQMLADPAAKQVHVRKYDHIWLMIGRDIHAAGFDGEDPATWGPHAVWCDSWQRSRRVLGRRYANSTWLEDRVRPRPNPAFFLDTRDHVRDGMPRVHSSFNTEL